MLLTCYHWIHGNQFAAYFRHSPTRLRNEGRKTEFLATAHDAANEFSLILQCCVLRSDGSEVGSFFGDRLSSEWEEVGALSKNKQTSAI